MGYWRSPKDPRFPWPMLVCIRQIDGRYYVWLPPHSPHALLVVHGNRLIRHHYAHGREIEREEFWARSDGTLAFRSRLPEKGGGFISVPFATFTRATGSATQLAAELRARFAEPIIDRQVNTLANALAGWANKHDSLPPRAALLPGGAFWRWSGAPHLTNAITGGPMVLGSAAGDFDYTKTGRWSYHLAGHLGYGQPDYTESKNG